MKRNIIKIDENLCNGCGLCVNACHEGAIQLIDGKAQLISDQYCDGLGNCLPVCPTGAIEIVEREAEEYSDKAVQALRKSKESVEVKPLACGCPGTMAKSLEKKSDVKIPQLEYKEKIHSELKQWPVQLKLVNSSAEYLEDAHLLIAADCTAYAYGNFHSDFIKDRITLIGCPKLDDNNYYKEKLTEILKNNNIKSITVVRMEVPCCSGIVASVKEAMLASQTIVPYKEVIIGIDGEIVQS